MYKILRNTHLILGMFCCLPVLVYGLSSIRFAHRDWVSMGVEDTEARLAVPVEKATDARTLALELNRGGKYKGLLRAIKQTDTGYQFRIVNLSQVHEIGYNRETGEASIKTRTSGLMGVLVRMHVQARTGTGWWLFDLWGWMVLITSAALILLGVTGVYLWFKMKPERVVGSILATIGLVYGLGLIVLIWTA